MRCTSIYQHSISSAPKRYEGMEEDVRENEMQGLQAVDYVRGIQGINSGKISLRDLFGNILYDKNEVVGDANLIISNGIYRCGKATFNMPVVYGILISFYTMGYNWQLVTNVVNSDIYSRTSGDNGRNWSEWKQLSFT